MKPATRAPRILSSVGPATVRPQAPEAVPVVLKDDRKPCFTSTWLERGGEGAGRLLAGYSVNGVPITISSQDDATTTRYDIHPQEYDLSPALVKVVAEVIQEITACPPEGLELGSMNMLRPLIKGRAKDVVHSRLAPRRGRRVSTSLTREVEFLAELVSKYTAGFGVLETLFEDRAVQDIYVNAPSSQTPVHVVLRSDTMERVGHKCRTNVFVGRSDLQGLVSRIKLETGMPFSEAQPVLEADIPRLGCRVTLVGPPISERGVSIAIRKHSTRLLTLPYLVAKDALSPLLASFLWACVLGRRAVLIAGSRGAGKTTLLGAMMLEFPLTQRILLIEDTPEIAVRRMRELGYDIQTLRFGGEASNDVSAGDTLRVSLRMGESAIVIGEVRGEEAKVLYESMRAGSAGSSVLGTIHGNSAAGVLDRAIEDLGVSERAFSSTDIVVVIGLIRTPDGSTFHRKVVEVSEVCYQEGEADLRTLFCMQHGCSCAKPTDAFSHESKTVQGIAGALGVTAEQVLDIVRSRAHSDEAMAMDENARALEGDEGRDGLRVASNELLVRQLFSPEGPDEAIKAWEEWYGRKMGRRA